MAFYIEADTIYITKGDDAVLEFSGITAQDGSQYELQPEDVLTLTVRELPSTVSPVLMQIDSLPGSRRIVIGHGDTSELNVGRYSADLQLTTPDDKRYTLWPNITGTNRYMVKNLNNFVIMPEVTAK